MQRSEIKHCSLPEAFLSFLWKILNKALRTGTTGILCQQIVVLVHHKVKLIFKLVLCVWKILIMHLLQNRVHLIKKKISSNQEWKINLILRLTTQICFKHTTSVKLQEYRLPEKCKAFSGRSMLPISMPPPLP